MFFLESVATAALSCMSLVQPYEGELNRDLPGNSSSIHFESCEILQGPGWTDMRVAAPFTLKQRTCVWGQCVTTWSYSGTAYGFMRLDGNCELSELDLRTSPATPMLDKLIPKAKEGVERRLPEVLADHPELEELCLR